MTEMCFMHCADNFFTRELSMEESTCLDRCVLKFSNVNQRVMTSYVQDQAIINERRMKEMEEQMKANETALAASAVTTAPVENHPSNIDINSTNVLDINAKTPILKLENAPNQNHSNTLAT